MILVTGSAGFIGRHVVKALNGNVATCDPRNLASRDAVSLANGLGNAIECVMHLGAISDTTCEDWSALHETNTLLTLRLFDFCAEKNIPFIWASSFSIVGNGDGPLNLYAWSKYDAEALVQVTEGKRPPHWYGLRFTNVYGPGEAHKGAQASMVHQLLNGKREMFAPNAKRDFIHVDDVVSVMLWIWKNLPPSGIYDVGTSQPRSFEEVARICHADVDWTDIPAALAPKYQTYTCADLTKLRAAGYDKGFMSLEDGVAKLISSRTTSRQPDRAK